MRIPQWVGHHKWLLLMIAASSSDHSHHSPVYRSWMAAYCEMLVPTKGPLILSVDNAFKETTNVTFHLQKTRWRLICLENTNTQLITLFYVTGIYNTIEMDDVLSVGIKTTRLKKPLFLSILADIAIQFVTFYDSIQHSIRWITTYTERVMSSPPITVK